MPTERKLGLKCNTHTIPWTISHLISYLASLKSLPSSSIIKKGPLSSLNRKKSNCNDSLKSPPPAANLVITLTCLSIRCNMVNKWLLVWDIALYCLLLETTFLKVFYKDHTMWLWPCISFPKCLSLIGLLKQDRLLKKGRTVVQPTGQVSFFSWMALNKFKQ